MITIGFSEEDVTALRYWRFQPPDPRVHVRMEALYLRSQGVTNGEILRLWKISKARFPRDLKAYVAGGVEQLKRLDHHRPHSELAHDRTTRAAYFQQPPPATVAEAAAKIADVTGMVRQPTQGRPFLRALGRKPLQVGMLPAKADVEAQEAFKKSLEPRGQAAGAGQRTVCFMDAAHFVCAPCLGLVWCFQRLFVTAPSGRQRVNVGAALKAITHEVLTVQHLTYITAETVCELWRLGANAQPDIPLTVILDNAPDQRCALVQSVAQTVGIEWLYFPTYSPNLKLIARCWKLVKKPGLYSKSYPASESFPNAIMACIEPAPILHKEALERWLTLRFQTFQAVSVIGEHHTVAKRSKKKVLSKAA